MRHGARVVVSCAWALLLVAGAATPAIESPGPRRFEITAARYQFTPAQIEVSEGETVELVLHSADTDHGLQIKAYKLAVAIPKGGQPVSVSFVASRPGRFPITCSEYCGSGHRRMRAELVVTEAVR